jgi:hypothetical protein
MTTIRIAVVHSRNGEFTTCTPDDSFLSGYKDQMAAACDWHESESTPVDHKFWVEFELPPIPEIPTVQARVVAHDEGDAS